MYPYNDLDTIIWINYLKFSLIKTKRAREAEKWEDKEMWFHNCHSLPIYHVAFCPLKACPFQKQIVNIYYLFSTALLSLKIRHCRYLQAVVIDGLKTQSQFPTKWFKNKTKVAEIKIHFGGINSTHNSERWLHSKVSRVYISKQFKGLFNYSQSKTMITIWGAEYANGSDVTIS